MINPYNAPVSPFTYVSGWESITEQGLLLSIASGVPDRGLIVEIGSEMGMSASLFRLVAPEAYLTCIDINPDVPYEMNLKEAGLWSVDMIRPVYADSKEINWRQLSLDLFQQLMNIDLLFVDGDHSYEGAHSDLVNFTPYIKKHGFLLVHDCACNTNKTPHELHHAVYSAVQEWLQRDGSRDGFRFMFSVDSTMVFKRMK